MNPTDRFAECIERARALGPLIVEHAAESERLGQLSTKVVDAFHDAGLFRVLLPARMGGFNLTMAQQCEVIEEIARFDGATGWNLAIGSAVRRSEASSRARRSRIFSPIRAHSAPVHSIPSATASSHAKADTASPAK